MAQIFLHYDENESGMNILGFYRDDVHSSIPTPNIEIDEDTWNDILENQGLRRVGGSPLEVQVYAPTVDLADVKAEAKRVVDNAASSARAKYITSGTGQDAVYLVKYDEAKAYKDAGYPATGSPSAYPHLTAEANGTGQTEQQVADTVIATRDTWLLLSAQIEGERLGGKKNIEDAVDGSGVNTARDNAVTALEAI